MAQYSIDRVEPHETITAVDLNGAFAGLKDNTDGTVSRIDTTNTGAGVVTRQHLAANAVHVGFVFGEGGAPSGAAIGTISSGTGGAATGWNDVLTLTLSATPTLASGDVLRFHFNLLIGDTEDSGTSGTSTLFREQQLYNLRAVAHFTDGAGGDTPITPAYGYSLNQRSTNESVTGLNRLQGVRLRHQVALTFKTCRSPGTYSMRYSRIWNGF